MQLFLAEQFTQTMLEEEVRSQEHQFYLAKVAHEWAGYCKLSRRQHPQLPSTLPAMEIARFYAMPPFVGKGVGKRMMEFVLSEAMGMGMQQVWLGVWERNHRAIQFYESFGFSIFSQQSFLLGQDLQNDWLMYRLL